MRTPRSLACPMLSASVLAPTVALGVPVTHRNGDGAWFEWLQRSPDYCWAYPGTWLDPTLPAQNQTGAPSEQTVIGINECRLTGCSPDTSSFAGDLYRPVHASIATDLVPREVSCCALESVPHIPELGYASEVGPPLVWQTETYSSYHCDPGSPDGFRIRSTFLGVRLSDGAGSYRYGWIQLVSRRRGSYPLAWAFETEPETPIATPPCAADLDFNFQVDFFDYLQFVQDFDAGHWITNFEYDDQLDFFDYLAFLEIYASCSE